MTQTTFLSQLRPGQSASIVRVGGRGPIRRRFAEMGFVSGEVVKVERVAPLGDPVEYRLKDYYLFLRREEASQIEVRLEVGGRCE